MSRLAEALAGVLHVVIGDALQGAAEALWDDGSLPGALDRLFGGVPDDGSSRLSVEHQQRFADALVAMSWVVDGKLSAAEHRALSRALERTGAEQGTVALVANAEQRLQSTPPVALIVEAMDALPKQKQRARARLFFALVDVGTCEGGDPPPAVYQAWRAVQSAARVSDDALAEMIAQRRRARTAAWPSKKKKR